MGEEGQLIVGAALTVIGASILVYTMLMMLKCRPGATSRHIDALELENRRLREQVINLQADGHRLAAIIRESNHDIH